MALNGNNDEANGYNSVAKNGETANVNFMKAIVPPIGSILPWCKTFDAADSGTTDGTTTDKLVQSGQNFLTTCAVNMIVYNTTDTTWAYITAVDSDTTLSLSTDIMISGENYTIYTTPTLPDGWVECDGSALSDSDSPYDGATLPDLNSTQSFLRGGATSGTTGGSDDHTHQWFETTGKTTYQSDGSSTQALTLGAIGAGAATVWDADNESSDLYAKDASTLPVHYEVVFIMRVK